VQRFAATGLLAACAVDQNFKAPAAPRNAGFAPPARLRRRPRRRRCRAAKAQRFVDGMDIPGQWWTLFQSAQLNCADRARARRTPDAAAAQAALRQANETAAAQRGSYYPSVSGTAQSERHKASGASLGFPDSEFLLLQPADCLGYVSYTLDAFGGTRRQVEALQAQAELQQFALEASYLTLTANIVAAAVNEPRCGADLGHGRIHLTRCKDAAAISRRSFRRGATSLRRVLQQNRSASAASQLSAAVRSQLAQQRNHLDLSLLFA